jgi:hypothetical protein
VLNVYKFRHLLRLSKLQQAIRLGKAAKIAGAAVVNVIEISSGSLSILIKLAELENELWAQDLLELLFWLEIATLSGELSAAVAKRLRASARKVLSHADVLKKKIRQLSPDDDVPVALINELKAILGISKPVIKFKHGWSISKLKLLSKKLRPSDVNQYLETSYITEHIDQFKGGATKIIASKPRSGPFAKSTNQIFVLPTKFADEIIDISHGNPRVLEVLLGLDKFDLGSNPFRIDFNSNLGLRIPNGKEYNANNFWKPGGFTSSDIPEAVINSTDNFTFTKIR